MRTHTRMAVVASLLLAACGSDKTSQSPAAVLSDARVDGGTAGFYFLPPVAPEPVEGTNDAGLAPVVEIAARQVAAVILRVARRPRPEVMVYPPARLMVILNAISPRLVDRIMAVYWNRVRPGL